MTETVKNRLLIKLLRTLPSLILFVATYSASMTCEGIFYQPVVPTKLRQG